MLSVLVVTLFFMYTLLDCISVVPRISGAVLEKNAISYSVTIMINTLKRVFIVSYPPILGWLSIGSPEVLVPTIFFSYAFAGAAVLIVFLVREKLILYFCSLISTYSESGNLVKSLIKAVSGCKNYVGVVSSDKFYMGVDKSLVYLSSWVYLVYGSSLFVINIVGFVYSDYSAVVYQLVGLVSALGTLVFAFILDPKISRFVEMKTKVVDSHNSLLLGQLISVVLLGPLLIFFLMLFFGL